MRSASPPALADHRRPLGCPPARYDRGRASARLGPTPTWVAAGAVVGANGLAALGVAADANRHRHAATPADTPRVMDRWCSMP
jgi:hypothetical protein